MTLQQLADSPAMRTSIAQLLTNPTLKILLDAIEKRVLEELIAETPQVVGVHYDTTVAAKKNKLAGKQWTVAMIRSFAEETTALSIQSEASEEEFSHAVPKEFHPKK
jgi:hypothetical protein